MVKTEHSTLGTLSAQLDAILRAADGPRQAEIAKKSGVNQSFVSRALNGKIVRVTKKASRLAQIVAHIYADMRKREMTAPRTINDAVRSYLAAGGDADLLIEQMHVLRRAVRPLRRSEIPVLDAGKVEVKS